ncbi:MAG: hypothetical protein L0Y80_07135 [Ignavibacteriae bacterium]|nr:hypothetical protein [Ignavibacteriota bacterium]
MHSPFVSRRAAFVLLIVSLMITTAPTYSQLTEEDGEPRFYVRLSGAMYSGVLYPTSFNAYQADGPAAANSYYTYEFGNPGGSIGFGFGAGYHASIGPIFLSGDLDFTTISHPESRETLIEDRYDSQTFTTTTIITTYQQSNRSNTAIIGTFNFGVYLTSGNELSLYLSAGLGYGWQSFTSAATKYAQTQGYDINTVQGSTIYDTGEYDGNGEFDRGSTLYVLGLGTEVFLAGNISIRVDYKYAGSSYSRENVLISSGAVNLYQDEKSYEYTFGNIFTGGISYYFE